MLNSERIRSKPSIQEVTESYPYAGNVPPRGLIIDGRPAMTQIDPRKAGDFVLMTVRDPLCAYSEDPAELLAKRLENPELIGRSGMFTSYTGMYKGAKITIVSGGSGAYPVRLHGIHQRPHLPAGRRFRRSWGQCLSRRYRHCVRGRAGGRDDRLLHSPRLSGSLPL